MKLNKSFDVTNPTELAQWISEVSRLFDNLGDINKVYSATATVDFASISANDYEDITVTVEGAVAGTKNTVEVGRPPGLEPEIIIESSVTADDTVTIRAHNVSTGAVDPAEATYRITVIQYN